LELANTEVTATQQACWKCCSRNAWGDGEHDHGCAHGEALAKIKALKADNLSLVNDLEAEGLTVRALQELLKAERELASVLYLKIPSLNSTPLPIGPTPYPERMCPKCHVFGGCLCGGPSSYPDRTCPVCHEDRNMYGGCRCNGYTTALASLPIAIFPQAVPCPTCGAPAGELCKGMEQDISRGYHDVRKRAAVMAKP
jgi:hypothetical protein